ncbi:hypothetical protein L914_20758 [Phytophthora nicotianae]|uniref:Uncharacterized protein n=1 Tax=Phytophthora nicotianae TaxID=4792 RepID=W2M877_PHYNI|nr:hypothetical protein L914_20758 [Phytophthora nicotianae]
MEAARLLLKRSSDGVGDESLLAIEDDEGSTAAHVATRNGLEDIACHQIQLFV